MKQITDILDKYLTTKAVAEVLSVSENTLKQWRCLRKGPGYIKFDGGFIRYPERELTNWIEDQRAGSAVSG